MQQMCLCSHAATFKDLLPFVGVPLFLAFEPKIIHHRPWSQPVNDSRHRFPVTDKPKVFLQSDFSIEPIICKDSERERQRKKRHSRRMSTTFDTQRRFISVRGKKMHWSRVLLSLVSLSSICLIVVHAQG